MRAPIMADVHANFDAPCALPATDVVVCAVAEACQKAMMDGSIGAEASSCQRQFWRRLHAPQKPRKSDGAKSNLACALSRAPALAVAAFLV